MCFAVYGSIKTEQAQPYICPGGRCHGNLENAGNLARLNFQIPFGIRLF
jgi:hypothetical protein